MDIRVEFSELDETDAFEGYCHYIVGGNAVSRPINDEITH
jgi:hypothetical protein